MNAKDLLLRVKEDDVKFISYQFTERKWLCKESGCSN